MSFRGGAALLAFLLAGLVFIIGWASLDSPTPEELANRCEASSPGWTSYDEDLKSSLGARAFATWRGEPVAARVVADALQVVFSLSGSWSNQVSGPPLLVRDHLGNVIPGRPTAGQGRERVYVFPLPPHGATPFPPWVTLRYPRAERRIPLNAEGRWP